MATPRPSASVVILSPTNTVLLLHRGSSAPSFASAHVFPGGNLDPFHDGELGPGPELPLHSDSLPFRLAAARECFEESGILLARPKDGRRDEGGRVVEMLSLDEQTREQGRLAVRDGTVKFADWVDGVGGFVDADNLVPFTRWITPITVARRFATQMYLYLLPTQEDGSAGLDLSYSLPAPDGREMTHAEFAPASAWLRRANAGEIMLYPPQYYLLNLVARFTSPPTSSETHSPVDSSTPRLSSPLNPANNPQTPSPEQVAHQRIALLTHIQYPTPPPSSPYPSTSPLSPARLNPHGTALARIPPGRRIICPRTLFVRSSDGSVVLGLDQSGPELHDTYLDVGDGGSDKVKCGGDGENVAVMSFGKGGTITRITILPREDVLREEDERKMSAMDGVVAAVTDVGLTGVTEEKL